MTLSRRRPSFRNLATRRAGLWICLATLSVLLVLTAPFGSAPPLFPRIVLVSAGHLPFLLILIAFAWFGPVWGLGVSAWAVCLMGLIGLGSGDPTLLWLPAVLLAFAALSYRGLKQWEQTARIESVRVDRIEEQINTQSEEIHRLQDLESAIEQRLKRYQQLRQIANAFNLSLTLEDLLESIVRAAGDLVQGTDHVLLYLVEEGSLQLELKKVWRRSGSATIKEKRGDAFDQWVMRQGQPLLVEEAGRDFRFPERGAQKAGRTFGSLLAVPLITEHRFLGVLRLESAAAHGLSPNDLRLLRILGDLASLGIENSYLYTRMAQLAVTDDLTGLAVREHFQKKLSDELIRAGKAKAPLSILLIDIDRFKVYNDSLGHSAGDKLIREIGALLLQVHRPGDLAGRFGGEEFVCLYPSTLRQEAVRRAEQIRVRVEATPIELRREVTRITVSIGVASFPEDGLTAETLLQAADRRLYQAKAKGRNQVWAEG